MQITADVSKMSKTFQCDRTFIFDILSESLFGFASYSVFQAVENVVNFTKKRFYSERDTVTMWKRFRTWLQNGIKVFDKIFVLQKIEMCDLPSKRHNSKMRVSTTSCSYIFLNPLQFLYQFHYLKRKKCQWRSKKILISLYRKPGN